MDHSPASDMPLRLARGGDDRVVVIFTPHGERLALSAAAARQSARDLARAARVAAHNCRLHPSVVRPRFDRLRHLPQRRWQASRARFRVQGLRRIVAVILLPIAVGLVAPAITGLGYAFYGGHGPALMLPVLGVLTLLLSGLLAWLAAPLVMTREERQPRPPPGSRPQLVVQGDPPGI